MELYNNNPEAFDEQRYDVLRETLKSWFPDDLEKQKKLISVIQHQDAELSNIKDPIEKFNRIQSKLLEKVGTLQEKNSELLITVSDALK